MMPDGLDQKLFDAAVHGMPPGRLTELRRDAAAKFAATGFPSTGDEDWKYTSLAAAEAVSNAWLTRLQRPADSDCRLPELTSSQLAARDQIAATWVVIRNGGIDPLSLQADNWPTGVHVSRLADESVLDGIVVDTPMSAFNAALLEDGIRLRIHKDTVVEKPIGILTIDDGPGQVSQIRVVIETGENAQLQLIQCATSATGDSRFTNDVTQIEVAPGAQVTHVRIQEHSHDHLSTHRVIVRLDRDASYSQAAFDLGGRLVRNDVVVSIDGRGANTNLAGLYLASGRQHIDNHTRVEHRVGPATSNEEYRGILTGQSRCVFNGQAVVFEGADGTDANQANHNLLLSDKAEIDTKPELEIYADDVKCSHGATVGQLDESSLFYLRSRGLAPDEARRILTRAFAANILDSMIIEEARSYVQERIETRLTELLEDGQS